MREQTDSFLGVNNFQLYKKSWLPDGAPKAIMAIVHGAGEHIHRYQNLADTLVPAGFILTGYDQRGHGRSDGQRGHINSWDEYREDLGRFLVLARELAPGLPLLTKIENFDRVFC